MSRRKAPAPAPRPARPRRPAIGPWLLVFAAGAFLAFTWWSMRARNAPPAPEAAPSAPWGDAARGMGPVEAFATGAALADSGRSRESLPYLHHAAVADGAPWHAWRAYASALHNVAMQGAEDPLTAREIPPRSSAERVALMRLALAHIDRAVALAAGPEDRAIALLTRAQFLRTWGLPWDALADFHAAGGADPRWADQAPFYAALMRNPDVATTP